MNLKLFRSRNFSALFSAYILSEFGTNMSMVAIMVYAYELRESSLDVALLLTARILPSVIVGPFSGLVIDRFSNRLILTFSQLFSGTFIFILTQTNNLIYLWTLLVLVSISQTFYVSARMAIMPKIIKKESLISANASFTTAISIARIAGPGLAGFIISLFSVTAILYIDALTYLVAAGLILLIEYTPGYNRIRASFNNILNDMRLGIYYILGNQPINFYAFLGSVVWLIIGMQMPLVLVFVTKVLVEGPSIYGLILTGGAAGAILGSFLTKNISNLFKQRYKLIISGLLTYSLLLIIFSVNRFVWGAVFLFFIMELILAIVSNVVHAYIQSTVSEENLGKVFGSAFVLFGPMMLLGIYAGGYLTKSIASYFLFFGSGVLVFLSTLIINLLLVRVSSNDFSISGSLRKS